MTTEEAMTIDEHISTARAFLERSDQEFAAGEVLQGSEKLWGAASQAVMAFAKQRGWDFGKTNTRRAAVRRLAEELAEPSLLTGVVAAEQFHANFYHDFMGDTRISEYRPIVSDFVRRVVELVNENA